MRYDRAGIYDRLGERARRGKFDRRVALAGTMCRGQSEEVVACTGESQAHFIFIEWPIFIEPAFSPISPTLSDSRYATTLTSCLSVIESA